MRRVGVLVAAIALAAGTVRAQDEGARIPALPVPPYAGGTGAANAFAINLAGPLTTTGAFGTTLAQTATTTITLPASNSSMAALNLAQTFALTQTFTLAPVFTDQAGSRTALGLGTAATQNTGTSGANVPLLNGANTWSGTNGFGTTTATTVAATDNSANVATTAYVVKHGIVSAGQIVISTTTVLGTSQSGGNIVTTQAATPITLTFPASGVVTYSVDNSSGNSAVVTLTFAGSGSDFKGFLNPGESVVLTSDGSGFFRTVASAGVNCATTAPTVSSGFGVSPSIVSSNGSCAFQLNVGTGGVATSGVIGLPTAAHGWVCQAEDITTESATVARTKQTASSTTTATVGNFNTTPAAAAWVASDKLNVSCKAY